MRVLRRKSLVVTVFAAAALAAASTAWAGGRHHGHGGYSRVSWGVSVGVGGPYWGYGPPPGYYHPAYGPPFAGSVGINYFGGRYGVSLAVPLYFGPRYAPPPVPVAMPVPVPVAGRQAPPAPAQQLPPGCLQTREYQTEIVVGGERVPAYGTACLQRDGSWKMLSGPIAAN
jgi:hypothetical protein